MISNQAVFWLTVLLSAVRCKVHFNTSSTRAKTIFLKSPAFSNKINNGDGNKAFEKVLCSILTVEYKICVERPALI
jgi:hypothetical protein